MIKPRAIINMELDSCTKPLRISIIKRDAALVYPNPAPARNTKSIECWSGIDLLYLPPQMNGIDGESLN